MIQSSKKQFFETGSLYSAAATCFFMPFSSSLLSLFSILTLLFWLLAGKFKDIPNSAKKNPIALISLFFFFLFILGLLYTSAEISYGLSILKKYREIIFIPILITLFKGNTHARKNCEYSFIAGCIILMLISYLMYASILPSARYGNSVVYHITHSYFMAVLAYFQCIKQ